MTDKLKRTNRVLILVWEFPPGPGGIGQHAYNFAKTLHNRKYEVIILTAADYTTKMEAANFDRDHPYFKTVRIGGSVPFKYFKRIGWVVTQTLKFKPDRIVCSGKSALWMLPLLRWMKKSNANLAAFLHGSELQLRNKITNWLTLRSLRYADGLFCVSAFTRNLLKNRQLEDAKIHIVPNGILQDDMVPLNSFSNQGVIKHGAPRILTVGQLTKRKGQHRVIKVLPHLIKFWPEIHYHMVGLDTNRKELTDLAESLGVEKHISIYGRVASRKDLFQTYVDADIFIMLSEEQSDGDVEGFGIAILEANFYGLPAIGAKGCGIEDAIATGTNGYLVDGDNEEEVAEAIQLCLQRREEMQPHMKNWVTKHNWNELIKKYLNP